MWVVGEKPIEREREGGLSMYIWGVGHVGIVV